MHSSGSINYVPYAEFFSSPYLWYNECMPLLFCSKWQMKTIGASFLYFFDFKRKENPVNLPGNNLLRRTSAAALDRFCCKFFMGI